MRLAVVIVSYNGRAFLERSLGSCRRHAPSVPVYVVENASTDGSAGYLAQYYPEAIVLPQTQNLGFAAGNNIGIRRALEDGAEAVLLLNQDAELTAGCATELVQYLAQHPEVGAVQPGIFLPDGRVNSLGNAYHYLGFGEAGGNGLSEVEARRALPWLAQGGEPPYLSGAAVLLRGAALQEVGLFDESLFMYHEDLELCLRLRLGGWSLALAPAARAVHHYEPSRSLRQFYYMERNRYVVWLSYWKLPTLLLLAVPGITAELLLLLVALVSGWAGVKFRVYAYLLTPASWRNILNHRRRVAELRRRSDRELLRHAEAVIRSVNKGGFITTYLFNPLSTLGWRLLFPLIRW